MTARKTISLTAGRVLVASMRWLIFTSWTSMNRARMDSPMGITAVWKMLLVRLYMSVPSSESKGPLSRASVPTWLMSWL